MLIGVVFEFFVFYFSVKFVSELYMSLAGLSNIVLFNFLNFPD